MTLIGAYGRTYNSRAAVLIDWHSGKDFIIADVFHGADGKPTNKFDCQAVSRCIADVLVDVSARINDNGSARRFVSDEIRGLRQALEVILRELH